MASPGADPETLLARLVAHRGPVEAAVRNAGTDNAVKAVRGRLMMDVIQPWGQHG